MRKFMKRLFLVLTAAFVILLSTVTVHAQENFHVFDLDDSMTMEQEEQLAAKITKAEKKLSLFIAVVVTDDLKGKSSRDYADDFYDEYFGINTDGILLLLDNQSQWDHISTSGRAISSYSDSYIDKIFGAMDKSLDRGDYYGAADRFLSMLDKKTAFWYAFKEKFLIGLLAGAVISLVTCLIIAHRYRVLQKISPRNYITENETRFTVKQDRYVRQYTSKVKTESSSGGGSSTHISSGGGTHGGHSHHR